MKAILLLLFLALLCSFIEGRSQDQMFRLMPQPGSTMIYKVTESEFLQNDEGEKKRVVNREKVLEIDYKQDEQQKRMLSVKVTGNKVEKPQNVPYAIRDYEFPVFRDGYYRTRDNDFYEYLVCGLIFKYEFNDENSLIHLINRDELLIAVKKRLEEKKFDKTGSERRIEDFNTIAIPVLNKYVQSIFQVDGRIMTPEEFDTKLKFNNSVLNVTNKRWDKMPGLYERNYAINREKNYLQSYKTSEIDSAKQGGYALRRTYKHHTKEQKIELININERKGKRFVVRGSISKQANKKVTLAFLRNPFGTELHTESVFLDENNSFYIETELHHPSLVFLLFGHTASTTPIPTLTLFAAPGNEISLDIKSESFPWNVEFEGSYTGAQNLLFYFNREYNWLKQKLSFNTIHWWWASNHQYHNLTNALKNFDSFNEKYKDSMPRHVFDFVTAELKSYLMVGVLRSLKTIEFQMKYYGKVLNKEEEEIEIEILEKALNNTEIHKIYKPSGLYSRRFARELLEYQYRTTRKVTDLSASDFSFSVASPAMRFISDLPHKIELAKNVLAGPSLYGQIADILIQENSEIYNKQTIDELYQNGEIEKYVDLINRVCNDREFTKSLQSILNTHSKWDNPGYVPEIKFFDEKGNAKYMKDFLGEKPTLFYISWDWGQERYFFDDLAEDNPGINLVLIAEGSNITEWMDYTKRAEPVAHQLFFINEHKPLNSIFKSSMHHFVAYDKNGVRIGFEGNMVSGMNLCKQSLEPQKKELNKSQLQLVIVVLLLVLTALLIFILLWKWRVRQDFRKQEQHRKLKELKLTAIRSQMNPHFLFNALNSVQNLVQQNKGREAHLYLSDFAGLIRKVLNNSEKEEVSLAEEIEMIQQYLNLEKLRFEFDFELSTDERIDYHNTMVPAMLLQPFVENAIIHGLQNKKGQRNLKVEFMQDTGRIKIVIEDNGIGRDAAQRIKVEKNGKGTKLVKDRIDLLKEQAGENYLLQIIDLSEGTRVELVVPEEN